VWWVSGGDGNKNRARREGGTAVARGSDRGGGAKRRRAGMGIVKKGEKGQGGCTVGRRRLRVGGWGKGCKGEGRGGRVGRLRINRKGECKWRGGEKGGRR